MGGSNKAPGGPSFEPGRAHSCTPVLRRGYGVGGGSLCLHVLRIVPLSINEHACVLRFRTALKVRKMRVVCILEKKKRKDNEYRAGRQRGRSLPPKRESGRPKRKYGRLGRRVGAAQKAVLFGLCLAGTLTHGDGAMASLWGVSFPAVQVLTPATPALSRLSLLLAKLHFGSRTRGAFRAKWDHSSPDSFSPHRPALYLGIIFLRVVAICNCRSYLLLRSSG